MPHARSSSCAESRCPCGRLLARLTDAGVELKCPRCHRVVLLAWSEVKDERRADPQDPARER